MLKDGVGTTVSGNGSAANPYKVDADGGAVAIGADTASVDTTVSGTGKAGDPIVISSDVRYSADPNNCAGPGTDGGIYVQCPEATAVADSPTVTHTGTGTALDPFIFTAAGGTGAPTMLSVLDTPSVDLTLTGDPVAGYVLSAVATSAALPAVNDSPTVTHTGTGAVGDPLIFTAADAPVAVTDSPTVTHTGTGTALDPFIFTAAAGAGALPTVVTEADTVTVNTTVTSTGTPAAPSFEVKADVIIAPDECVPNGLDADPAGLFAETQSYQSRYFGITPLTTTGADQRIGGTATPVILNTVLEDFQPSTGPLWRLNADSSITILCSGFYFIAAAMQILTDTANFPNGQGLRQINAGVTRLPTPAGTVIVLASARDVSRTGDLAFQNGAAAVPRAATIAHLNAGDSLQMITDLNYVIAGVPAAVSSDFDIAYIGRNL